MPCELYPPTTGSRGYVRVWYGKKMVYRHRLAYAQHHGLPLAALDGWHVRHTCDTRNCCNPHHLILGTNADNMRDKAERSTAGALEYAGRAKLTNKQVLYCRLVYVPRHKEFGARALARRFGVSSQAMSAAISGKQWRKLGG